MINQHSTFIAIAISTGLLLGCSSDSDPFTTPTTSIGDPTGIADQNSFTLSKAIIVVEGLNSNVNNSENTISVYVADRHNHAVPDNTVVNFLTDAGALITRACVTVDGACSVIWRSQEPKPVNGRATVLAYTTGEESFLDTNDNDKFDAGESTLDISEPFIDSNQNLVYDSIEEFVDHNANSIFDGPDGLYTGEQCVGDNTVCNRSQLFVWTSTNFGVADSFPATSGGVGFTVFSDTSAPAGNKAFVQIQVVDLNGIGMADGATIELEASAGTFTTSSFTAAAGSTTYSTTYTAPATAGNVTFTITVTQPTTGNITTHTLTFVVT